MGNEDLERYRTSQLKITQRMNTFAGKGIFFRLFLLRILPMAFLAGLKVKQIDENKCIIAVPFKWLNKNPFRSTYFAVLGMAAEMSTGLPAFSYTYKSKPALSMLVTGMQANFGKKANGYTYFTFSQNRLMKEAIEKAILTGEGVAFEGLTIGTNDAGNEVARFTITWSFRVKIG